MTDHCLLEFSRIIPLEQAVRGAMKEDIDANEEECAALARRFDLSGLRALKARFFLTPVGKGAYDLVVEGSAEVEYVCVATLDVFISALSFRGHRVFFPVLGDGDSDADHDQLSPQGIDIGEVVAEELGLSLDPYPKKPKAGHGQGAEASLSVLPQPQGSHPFSILKTRLSEASGDLRTDDHEKET